MRQSEHATSFAAHHRLSAAAGRLLRGLGGAAPATGDRPSGIPLQRCQSTLSVSPAMADQGAPHHRGGGTSRSLYPCRGDAAGCLCAQFRGTKAEVRVRRRPHSQLHQ